MPCDICGEPYPVEEADSVTEAVLDHFEEEHGWPDDFDPSQMDGITG